MYTSVCINAVKPDGVLEVLLQSFPALEIGRSEREFPHHIRLSSGKELSVSTEQEAGWKAELVWMLRGGETFYSCRESNRDSSDFQPAAYTVAVLTQYANTPL